MVSKIRNSLNTERLALNANNGWKYKMDLESQVLRICMSSILLTIQ